MSTKKLSGYRFVTIRHGDTLQAIAARELGDTTRWVDLIAINDLVHPYLTGDPELAGERVRLYGATLTVPAQEAQTVDEGDDERVFLVDMRLRKGLLEADESGDLAVVAGVENFRQALTHRIATPTKELLFHQGYGCEVHSLIGQGGLGGVNALAAGFVKSSLGHDTRVQQVPAATARLAGDAIDIRATVQPKSGTPIDIEVTT